MAKWYGSAVPAICRNPGRSTQSAAVGCYIADPAASEEEAMRFIQIIEYETDRPDETRRSVRPA
jgi:hypothetical protein